MAGGPVLPMVESEGNIVDGKSAGAYEIGCIGDGVDDISRVIGWAEGGSLMGTWAVEGGRGAG